MFGSSRGQLFLTFALIFSFTVVMLSIYLNEVMMSGYEVSKGINVPYYEIRMIVHEIARSYKHGDWNYTKNNETLSEYLSEIFARHGYDLNLTFYNETLAQRVSILHINGSLRTVNLNVTFNNKLISR